MEKALVVIGASSDMGMTLIEQTLGRYEWLVVHYRNKNEKLRTILEKAGDRIGKEHVLEIKCDFSSEESSQQLIEDSFAAIADKVKEAEVHLVHFAAQQSSNNRFHKIPWEVFQNEIDISLRSFICVAQIFLPLMAKLRAGKIVLMLSYLTEISPPPKFCTNYITVKYALLGLMKALASEYADRGITVNGVSPAVVETKYIRNQPEIVLKKWIDKSPIGRNMVVEEIVPTIMFLLTDEAKCINGENIVVSCGMSPV